jgi:hypothetical protein
MVTFDPLSNRILFLVPGYHVLFLVEYMKRIKSIFASSRRPKAGNFVRHEQVFGPAKEPDGNFKLKISHTSYFQANNVDALIYCIVFILMNVSTVTFKVAAVY